MDRSNTEPVEGQTASELARALASMRHRVEGVCEVCGKPIEGVQKHGEIARRYCSYKCSKAAYRARVKTREGSAEAGKDLDEEG